MGADAPSYEVMDTGSPTFAQYLKLRANRHDSFYNHPAGGVDVCNVQVPIRKKA
jgi:peptidylprolyl isomerase